MSRRICIKINNCINYLIKTILYLNILFYKTIFFRKFDYEISKNSVNDSSIAGYLRTECGAKDICAGTLFPGKNNNLKKK